MIPIQEFEVHTSKDVVYKAQVIRLRGSSTFHSEVALHEATAHPSFASTVRFDEAFQDASGAYECALAWVAEHARKNNHSLTHIDNPCNCEFIKKPAQESVVRKLGLNLPVRENGA